ncbi:MAG: hypothetical protein BWK78_06290 [Thiotrichaceae bacterium IS1]|nr:MAG: hypothetical protein BWK78_06290 [Thiotrichaceae bacterium IS1]
MSNFQLYLNQAQVAQQHYLQTGNLSALDDSITAWERILQHPEFATVTEEFRLRVLNNSAVIYIYRYKAQGKLTDLDRALSGWQRLRESLFDDSPYLPTILTNLGNGWRCRYQRTGAVGDLDAGIECFQQAVSLTPADAPDLPSILTSLGAGLIFRYQRTGVIGNLDAGIECFQQAVSLTPSDAPDQAMFLTSLGIGLTDRYQRTGAVGDLDAGIQCYQQAVALTPTDAPDRAMFLTNLGTGLRDRYQRTGAVGDLDAGIQRFQQAVVLTPADAPDRAMFLTNLGNGLRDRYQRTGAVGDLDAGIQCFQQAVALTPADAPNKAMYLNKGTGLTDRYQRTGAMGDLDVGIECFQQAVALAPTDSPNLPGHLVNLGNGLKDRYQRTGAVVDLDAGIQCFQQAAQRGLEMAMEVVLGSASNWLHWAFGRQSWPEVTQAHSYAYKAGQRLLKVQLLRTHKESWLKEMQGLASQAAYAFTKLNQPKEAVVTLEGGIAILLSEALQRDRADLEQLKTTGRTDLYDRYQDLVGRYHWAQQYQNIEALKTTQTDLDKTIEDIRQVPGYENFLMPLDKTIEDIRQVPGYENFLMLPKFKLIQVAAQETPLVYILTTSAGGLALIVRRDEEITPVWLEKLTTTALQEHVANYRHAYEQRHKNQSAWFEMLEQTTHWLGQVLMDKLSQTLKANEQVTLIPVGLLNLLPLHAAWTEEVPGHRCYALDKLTIAYAPNARALTEARQIAQRVAPENLLAVINPRPVHADSLDHSELEVQTIATLFEPANQHLLLHEQATCEAVLNSLPTAKILHFSGHGQANLSEPLQSCLLMAYDEGLTVAELLNLRLTTGIRLATISACETGLPGVQLPDEVVNLPAGLLQAGVASVVASLWSVSNLSTALLMIRFYDNLQQHWHTAGTPAAIAPALQEAQRWLRDLTYDHLKEWIADKKLSLTDDQVADLRRQYRRDPTLFAKPYYWAAFSAVGH